MKTTAFLDQNGLLKLGQRTFYYSKSLGYPILAFVKQKYADDVVIFFGNYLVCSAE